MALQTFVRIDEEQHRYWDTNGLEYLSAGKVVDFVKPFFDKELISAQSAKKQERSQEDVLREWKEKNDDSITHGKIIHSGIEVFQNTGVISAEYLKYEQMIRSICAMYKDYARVFQEEILFSSKYRIAGTCDKILKITSHKDSYIDIEDYKTNKSKGIQYFSTYRKKMLEPITHLEDCNFTHYALQLSIYAYMLEETFGKKVRMLHIVYIPPDNYLNWKKIPVLYQRTDVIRILEFYKHSIIKMLDGRKPAVEQIEEPNF